MSYDDLDFYYVFADAKTFDILFLNNAVCSFLNLKLEDCIGRKCHEIIYNRNEVCPFCVNEELISSKFNSMEIVQPLNKIDINCHITLVPMDGRLVRVSKMPITADTTENVVGLTDNDILRDLIANIKKDNFQIHLQPKFEVTKVDNKFQTKLVGAEALVRRYDSNLNEVIFPDDFISFYENMSIIRHLDLYVLEKVCHLTSIIMKKDKFANSNFVTSVNFSCATLLEFDCINNIKAICDKFNVPYSNIMIEISKDNFLESHKSFIKMILSNLSKLGFRLSISNIDISNPTTYSLQVLNFDEIKICKDLLARSDIHFDEYTISSFSEVVSNYRKNSNIVAVGVETDLQMQFFNDINCNLQQGFLHSTPLTVHDFFNKYCS